MRSGIMGVGERPAASRAAAKRTGLARRSAALVALVFALFAVFAAVDAKVCNKCEQTEDGTYTCVEVACEVETGELVADKTDAEGGDEASKAGERAFGCVLQINMRSERMA